LNLNANSAVLSVGFWAKMHGFGAFDTEIFSIDDVT